jgi:DNA-binding NarL/FixJ family response regulator
MDATHTDAANTDITDPPIVTAGRTDQLRGLLSTQPDEVSLTERELTVLDGVARGMTNRQIADEMYLSVDTVKTHARRLYAKLGVSNRTQAAMRGRWRSDLPSMRATPGEDAPRFA